MSCLLPHETRLICKRNHDSKNLIDPRIAKDTFSLAAAALNFVGLARRMLSIRLCSTASFSLPGAA